MVTTTPKSLFGLALALLLPATSCTREAERDVFPSAIGDALRNTTEFEIYEVTDGGGLDLDSYSRVDLDGNRKETLLLHIEMSIQEGMRREPSRGTLTAALNFEFVVKCEWDQHDIRLMVQQEPRPSIVYLVDGDGDGSSRHDGTLVDHLNAFFP